MRFRILILALFAVVVFDGYVHAAPSTPQEVRKDYLTESEADKIRDAMLPPDRIKLFVSFADDRLKKFQYELTRATREGRRAEILNSLLNAYSGCMDDAADQIDEGIGFDGAVVGHVALSRCVVGAALCVMRRHPSHSGRHANAEHHEARLPLRIILPRQPFARAPA